jgi:hypothetical protein
LFIHLDCGRDKEKAGQAGLYHPVVIQAIAEGAKTPKSCVTLVCAATKAQPLSAYRIMRFFD